jgi:hypothetical protein
VFHRNTVEDQVRLIRKAQVYAELIDHHQQLQIQSGRSPKRKPSELREGMLAGYSLSIKDKRIMNKN